MKFFARLTMLIMLILVCMILAACPSPVDTEYIQNGDYFRSMITSELLGRYGVNFSASDQPMVSVAYLADEGSEKICEFILDGYDSEKHIGYKLVVKKDMELWEKSREKGELKAPEMRDREFIQKASLQFDYPIVFVWAYPYQDDLRQKDIEANRKEFKKSIEELLSNQEMINWAQQGLYNGEWIKEGIEKSAFYSFNIEFLHTDLPNIEMEYGDNQKAIFEIDGFDPDKQIGYLFVTADTEAEWNKQRLMGNSFAPDISQSAIMKQAALEYEFPILFIHVPRYWESTVSKIVGDELYITIYSNDRISKWLKEH